MKNVDFISLAESLTELLRSTDSEILPMQRDTVNTLRTVVLRYNLLKQHERLKPYKGAIKDWRRLECNNEPGSLGYQILGTFVDHPEFAGHEGYTSCVMTHDLTTGQIETRNSRYLLLPPVD